MYVLEHGGLFFKKPFRPLINDPKNVFTITNFHGLLGQKWYSGPIAAQIIDQNSIFQKLLIAYIILKQILWGIRNAMETGCQNEMIFR